MSLNTRPVTAQDKNAVVSLINYEYYIHRHLDWRSALDWLGRTPYWLLERGHRPLAALAFPPDPPEIAWIRLFAASASIGPKEAWKLLFPRAFDELYRGSACPIGALALQPWFTELLEENRFTRFQDIVVLAFDHLSPPTRPIRKESWKIRAMVEADLDEVRCVDNTSFEPLWQISHATLAHSFHQAAYATVVEMEGKILAYQISTMTVYNAHLARLAVLPEMQRGGLGSALLQDLLTHFHNRHVRQVTVNTQSTNHSSLALYQKTGFELTGERFPVYLYEQS